MSAIVFFLRAVLGDRAAIAAENLALRQQLAVLQVSVKRPRLRKRDRFFWVWLARLWSNWRSCTSCCSARFDNEFSGTGSLRYD